MGGSKEESERTKESASEWSKLGRIGSNIGIIQKSARQQKRYL